MTRRISHPGWPDRGSHRPVPLVILTPRFTGERILVRLLSASGAVRCSGAVLSRKVPNPGRHLRQSLLRSGPGEAVHAALVHPDDLWLRNGMRDYDDFIAGLAGDGFRLVTLLRRNHQDRGLSRALCRTMEILPAAPQTVDPAEVALFTQDSERTEEWFAALPGDPLRLTFEDDLADAASRSATLARLEPWLGLSPSSEAPPEPSVPDHDALWKLVANRMELEESLGVLAAVAGKQETAP